MTAELPQQRQTSTLLLIVSQFAQSTAEDSGSEVRKWKSSPDISTYHWDDVFKTLRRLGEPPEWLNLILSRKNCKRQIEPNST